jgi:hypothetical protein
MIWAVAKRTLPYLLPLVLGAWGGVFFSTDAEKIADLEVINALQGMELQMAREELVKKELQSKLLEEINANIQKELELWKKEALQRKKNWEDIKNANPEVKAWADRIYRGVD